MKLLISGVAGFVGSHLAEYFSNFSEVQCVGFDDLSRGYIERLEGIQGLEFHEISLRGFCSRNLHAKFDLIIHCSAIAPLPECEVSTADCIDSNVSDTICI